MDYLIPIQRPDLIIKKERTCCLVDFAFTANYEAKIKERKKDKYLDLARELK